MNLFKEIYANVKEEKDLYFELGRTLITQNKFRRAIEFLLEAKHIAGTKAADWELSYLLGEGYKSLSQIKDAFENFIEAAINTGEFKSQCYDQAKKLINPSTAMDLQRWLKSETNSTQYAEISDIDKNELNNLIAFCGLFTQEAQNPNHATLPSIIKINSLIDEANALISSNQYKNALKKIEEALTSEPANYEILFIKIRILIEGQIDTNAATVLFNDEEFGYCKQFQHSEIISKIEELLINNAAKGDSYFFAAFIGRLLDHDKNVIDSWLEKAASLGLKNENVYPLLGLHLLKGEIAEKEDNRVEAGSNFLETAKCYYWQAGYTQAAKYFEKAIQLNPNLIAAYNYYADTLFLLSYQPDPPYNIKDFVDKAYNAWHDSPAKIVQTKTDTWHYIVIARIHEIKYKFDAINFYTEYWQAVLYAERAIVHKEDDYTLWMYLGMFYRNLDMDVNSKSAFDRAEALNDSDELLKEETIILLVNMGAYEKPLRYLKELKEKSVTIPGIYKSYHKSWEGYIIFHKDKNPKEAARVFDQVISETYPYLFAHQMKMICHWHAHELAEAKREANEIIALRDKYTYAKEEFTFSWALFISGHPEEAISMLEINSMKAGYVMDNSFSLLQFYLYTGQIENATNAFNTFIEWTYSKKVLSELLRRFDALEFQFNSDKPNFYFKAEIFQNILSGWIKQINEKIEIVTNNPIKNEDELIAKQGEFNYEEGSIPFIAVKAGLARVKRDEKNLPEAYRAYISLAPYEAKFPEVKNALEQIETAVFILPREYIRDMKYTDAIEYLQKFDIQDPAKLSIKNILISLAYFGHNNEEKALQFLKASFRGIAGDMENQNQVWIELTEDAYISKLTWDFGYFIKRNTGNLQETYAGELMHHMLRKFWNILINKANVSSPLVTPIAIEIRNDLAPAEADTDQWYVIKDLIPAMRDRIFENYGVKPPGVRIRGNDDLAAGTYIISLEEVPLVLGTVYKDRVFITEPEKDLQPLSISGETGIDYCSGKNSMWVNSAYKNLLDENNIGYWDDYFYYLLAHLEAVLVQNLEIFVDTQFSDDYLVNYATEKKEDNLVDAFKDPKIIQENTSLISLFTEVLKGLVREKISIINKHIIIPSFFKANIICPDASGIIQAVRIDLKKELPVNNLKSTSFKLPGETEKSLKEELRTTAGKTFLAMTPENCQETLAIIRNIMPNDTGHLNLVLVTNDSQLRIHLKKLTALEFPNLIVASQEELREN